MAHGAQDHAARVPLSVNGGVVEGVLRACEEAQRVGVRFRPDWPLEITGVFAEVWEEAKSDLSYCKLSPGSFMNDKPPTLNFRALLTEGGADRLELARA